MISTQMPCTMRSVRHVGALLLAFTLAVLATGCDGNEAAQPPATSPGTTTGAQERSSVVVYHLRDGKIAPVRRSVPATAAVARAALTELLAGPTADEAAAGLVSAIPTGTRLNDVVVADGVATVDLSGSFDDGGGSASMLGRVAQVVATLTRFPTIRRVAFWLDGEPVEALGGEGVVVDPPVDRAAIEDQTPQILIESPLPGDAVTSPVRVRGTANVFEANVSLEVRDESGSVLLETFTTATSGNGTRGTFDTRLAPSGAEGTITIVAFEASAEDGRPLHETRVRVALAP